jgi:hypothetical protein
MHSLEGNGKKRLVRSFNKGALKEDCQEVTLVRGRRNYRHFPGGLYGELGGTE